MRLPVNENRIGNSFHTLHRELNPLFRKPHLMHHCFQKGPFNLVIGLAHIELKIHETLFAFQPFNLESIVWRVSKATRMLSVIKRLGIKALCSRDIMRGKMILRLLASTFAISL
jgi:hypothetical protein